MVQPVHLPGNIQSLAIILLRQDKRIRNISLSAFFTGLAILTKGPVALLILFLVFLVCLIYRRFRIQTSFRDVADFHSDPLCNRRILVYSCRY